MCRLDNTHSDDVHWGSKTRFPKSKCFIFEHWWLREPEKSTLLLFRIGALLNHILIFLLDGISNFRRRRGALRKWAASKDIINKALKGKLIWEIARLDCEEGKVDISPNELKTRNILKDDLHDLYVERELYWKHGSRR